jgi:N-acetylglucosamine transport system permease protein
VGIWNEYNFALVFITNPQLKTLPVGLYYLVVTQQYAAEWPALFAGIVILFVPTFLIFLVLQKQIIAGLTLGSVKG